MSDAMRADACDRAARIRLMIFDVDGILTDGSLQYGAEGEIVKSFNVLDGLGIKLLQQSGVGTAIITARKSEIVARRAADSVSNTSCKVCMTNSRASRVCWHAPR